MEQVATPETEGMSIEQRTGVLSGLMDQVIAAAAAMARIGDTVLLAPAAASLDMFDSYESRGHAFSRAVRRRADSEQAI